MAIPLATIQTWLDEALTAKHEFSIGKSVARVGGQDGDITFTPADGPRLDAYINKLQGWIAAGGIPDAASVGSYKPIHFTF